MSVHVAVLTISEQRAVGIMGLRNIAMEAFRIAQCLLIQTKRDKENMKHKSTTAVGKTHTYTETTGK